MKILNVNIDGLQAKNEILIKYIKENNFDIVNLQEVKFTKKNAFTDKLEKETKGFLYSNSNYIHHGVATLVKNSILNYKIQQIEIKDEIFRNRVLHLQIQAEEIFNIINIYAPVNNDNLIKLRFFNKLKEHLYKFKNQNIILTGDFNYVSRNIDRETGMNYLDKLINTIMDYNNFKLKDVYKTIHPNDLNFTTRKSRLDRFYISEHLMTKIIKIKHGKFLSDHKTVEIEINIEKLQKWGKGYWKINNNYFKDLEYKEIIKNEINLQNSNLIEDPLDRWESMKKRFKKKSINYAIIKSKQRKDQEEACKDILEQNFSQEIKQNAKKKLNEIQNFKNEGIKVRTKNPNLNEIYSKGKELNRKEEIRKGNAKAIIKINGKSEKDEILEETYKFYSKLYEKQNIDENEIDNYLLNFNPEQISQNEKEILDQFISNDEILQAIKQLNSNKSPGKDGLTAEFYKTFDTDLVMNLNELYNNILLTGNATESMNMGIITLIYKNKGNLDDLKNWRPITLLNLDYKILTKILTNRLKLIQTNIINNLQSSGILNKSIINNALNIENIIKYIEENENEAVILSLDQEKAFDRVEHNYLFKVLEKYNFPKNFINFIKILYKDVKSKVQVNGMFTEDIQIQRSVRQGCPLSMFLYVLSLEPFIASINNNKNIKGLKIPNFLEEIKSLQHADDTTVILENENSYYHLNNEIKNFEKISGSKINDNKLQILIIGENNKPLDQLPLKYVKENIKIYGVYFGKNYIEENMNKLLLEITQIIEKWKNVKLNLVEKVIVIKTYIISKIQYLQRVIEIPKFYIDKLNKLIFTYLWDGQDKISRKTITNNLNRGGLGLTDIETSILTSKVQRFKNLIENKNQPWTALYIYWFGIDLKFYVKDFALNKYVHNFYIPQDLKPIKNNLQYLKNIDNIWEISKTNTIYKILIDERRIKPKIEQKIENINWNLIWKCLNEVKVLNYKSIIYRYLHKVLPIDSYLTKRGFFREIPKCTLCKKALHTYKHILLDCEILKEKREKLYKDLKMYKQNVNINLLLLENGSNNLDENLEDKHVCKAVFIFFLDIWELIIEKLDGK